MNFIKYFIYSVIALALVGCSKDSIEETSGVSTKMKTVTISSGIEEITRASVDSQTGAFAWQSGDLISVLATDGKFYDFILKDGEAGKKVAEFTGSIPETANVTTVATYPRIVANGSESNTVLEGSTLNYNLPATWTYAKDVSNVPMVAAFDEAAEHMSFKQVGGVMRFPVKNLPTEAKFVLSMNKTITGSFPVNISSLGESAMVAGETAASSVTINYTSDVDGAAAEFNVPVPTGVYAKFKVEILGANDEVLFTKEYPNSYEIKRATLFNMKELVMDERPMVIAEVWPFFVDARVVFGKCEADAFAFYIDGAETPVIVEAEDLGDKFGALIGGEFKHNTTHSVAVAKVIDGQVVAGSKSEAVEFTTGDVFQLTTNTGTKFVSAGWDDVAIGVENSTVYNKTTKKWSMVALNSAIHDRNIRGYRVQLYAEDKTTLLYDEVPFSGQVDYGGAISNSSWIGKIGGKNVLLPAALSFGWLEPGKKYYFRVQTLTEPVVFDSPANGYFKPDGAPCTVSSARGGCAWSEFVEMTTDAPHVATENEVFYEGFDDMMFNNDIMNVCSAAVPEFLTKATKDSNYKSVASAALYQQWADLPFAERKFSEQGFNTMLGVFYHGLTDDATNAKNVPSYLNKYAGSLEGWSVVIGTDNKPTRTVNPNFGTVRLGESGTASGKVNFRTAPIMSDKLSETVPTKCIITVKVSAQATSEQNVNAVLGVYHYRGTTALNEKNTVQFNLDENGVISSEWSENYTWTDKNNYIHYPTWFEVKTELNLLKGDVIGFEKSNPKVDGVSDFYGGCITIGEVLVEVDSTAAEFVDDGVGTEPDDTNYDVYGLGEFPISFWWTVPTAAHNYDPDKTFNFYQDMANSGINVVNYVGELDCSVNENVRIMNVCTELGMKFIGNVWAPTNAERIAAIKANLASSPTYVGEHLCDEPNVAEFAGLSEFVNAYNAELPDKDVYINLFPEYANAATQLGTDYENYINQYLAKVKTKSLSYDYYGLHTNGSIFSSFYSNLDLVRKKTLDKRMPFWVITQSGIAGSAKMPTELEQRWSVWANIAVGSKGISYFCYWTPSTVHGEYDDNGFMVDINGNKQDMYYWVQKINADINTVGKKLLPCHADGAIMTSTTYYPLYTNNGLGRTKYGPIEAVNGSTATLCGCFRDARISENGDNFKGYKALVVCEFPNRDVTADLTLNASINKVTITHNNTTQVVDLMSNMAPVTIGTVTVTYIDGVMSLAIPSGEAALVEF